LFVFMPLLKRFGGSLLAGAFLMMAVGTALLPYAANYYVLLLGVGLISASSGILIPALAYLTSLAAGVRQGATLGAQTAIANLGQAAGSAAAGWLFGVVAGAPFWAAAGLLGLGAVAALNNSYRFKEGRL
jgi:MFS family permease